MYNVKMPKLTKMSKTLKCYFVLLVGIVIIVLIWWPNNAEHGRKKLTCNPEVESMFSFSPRLRFVVVREGVDNQKVETLKGNFSYQAHQVLCSSP